METLIKSIINEAEQAKKTYGSFNSTHEMYAVLKEEVDEFWDVVKKNTERNYGMAKFKVPDLTAELIQIAAIAIRAINELETSKTKHI